MPKTTDNVVAVTFAPASAPAPKGEAKGRLGKFRVGRSVPTAYSSKHKLAARPSARASPLGVRERRF